MINQTLKLFTRAVLMMLFIVVPTRTVKADQFGDFGYTNNGTVVTITNYSGLAAVAYVPDVINGLPVNCIGNNAFQDHYVVRRVVLPNSLAAIGDSAFHSCTNLTDITIPGSVTNIGYDAFEACFNLTNVIISEGLIRLGGVHF